MNNIEQITKIRILNDTLQYLTFGGVWKYLLTLDELESIRSNDSITSSNPVADAFSVTTIQTNLDTLETSIASVAAFTETDIDWNTSKFLTITLATDVELFDINLPDSPNTKEITLIVTPSGNTVTLPEYWKTISGTISTAKDNVIEAFCINSDSQKQVDTVTLTGTSGTATMGAVGGLTKTVTFATAGTTDLPQTAADFVTSFAADYLAEKIVITSSGADIIFTSQYAGYDFTNPTIVNATGDLAGTVSNTSANIAPIVWVKIYQEA